MAFHIIDNENDDFMSNNLDGGSDNTKLTEPIYENVDATPKKAPEPYYQVPRTVPIPLYENVELMFPATTENSRSSMAESNGSFGVDDGTEIIIDQFKYLMMEPPKEKPPPLPAQEKFENQNQMENFLRINSTKRIKKEIRNKRSSFLGIEGEEIEESALNLSVAPPPDMQLLLQEERRLKKQLYQKVDLHRNQDYGKILLQKLPY